MKKILCLALTPLFFCASYAPAFASREILAGVYDGSKWGFIDSAGNVVIEPQWDRVLSFH